MKNTKKTQKTNLLTNLIKWSSGRISTRCDIIKVEFYLLSTFIFSKGRRVIICNSNRYDFILPFYLYFYKKSINNID